MRDNIYEAMFLHEFGALESGGEFFPDGLLDDARSCKGDERFRLRDIYIAEHGKACGYAAGRRVGENGNIGQSRFGELRERVWNTLMREARAAEFELQA